MVHTLISNSSEQTKNIGFEFAKRIYGGDVISLIGDLAAGKTTFVQGVGQYFGLDKITSPTFIIMNQYPLSAQFLPLLSLSHLDCYRLESASQLRAIDLYELLSDQTNVTFIEWPEKINLGLSQTNYQISFSVLSDQSRSIQIAKVK